MMPRRLHHRVFVALVLVVGALAAMPAAAQDPRESTVQRAAREWLAVIDRADYALCVDLHARPEGRLLASQDVRGGGQGKAESASGEFH